MSEYNINGLAIPLFMFFMAIEYIFLRLKGKHLHRYNDSVNSLSMGMCLLISDALLKTFTFAAYLYLWENHRSLNFSMREPITWVLFFFVLDLCYYAFHRAAHEINFLWGAHVGHHQSEEYNLTTALRQSAFQYAFSWVFYLPLAFLGCPPQVFLILFILLKLYQFGLHTQAINKVPLIEGIFSTPSSHRVHHAKNPMYIDRNYGGTLAIWDRIFGTWQPELAQEPCHYGTTQPLNTLNPIKANLQHWQMLAKDTVKTASWYDKFILWFKPTGWRPRDCRKDGGSTSKLQSTGSNNTVKYDPQVSKRVKIYTAINFLLLIAITVMFLFMSPKISALMLVLGTFTVVYGFVAISHFLEGRKSLTFFELIRLPVTFWLASHLWFSTSTTQIINTIVMDKPAAQVLSYASSPGLWPDWHPQSSKVYVSSLQPLIKGDTFEEDIQTVLGKNHLSWQVIQSTNDTWIAEAYNQTNGSTIRLQYQVRALGNQSEFERTLDYTMPNFAFVTANALFFKSKVEQKSADALLRLKNAVNAKFSS